MKYTPQGAPMLIADDLLVKAKALYAELNRRKALETALIALEIYETWLGPRHPATMNCYAFAGLLYHSNQEPETGIRMIREAISYDEERYGHICDPLGLALNMIGDLKRALRMTEKAFRISMRHNGFRHSDTALQFEKRARIFKKAGVKAEEIHNLEMALYIYSALYGDDSSRAQEVQKALDEAKASSTQ